MSLKNVPIAIFVVITSSCLQENEETDFTTPPSTISFNHFVEEEVSQSYLLEVDQWALASDGRQEYVHSGGDEFDGLRAKTNNSDTLTNLKFQISKDLGNLTNYLSVDGEFLTAQTLTVSLPHTMLDLNPFGLLLQDDQTANLRHPRACAY